MSTTTQQTALELAAARVIAGLTRQRDSTPLHRSDGSFTVRERSATCPPLNATGSSSGSEFAVDGGFQIRESKTTI